MLKFEVLSSSLLLIGILGLYLVSRHMLICLISIELMLLAANMNFVAFSVYLDDILGQLFCLMVMTVGAAETALGLAILMVYYKLSGGMSADLMSRLKS